MQHAGVSNFGSGQESLAVTVMMRARKVASKNDLRPAMLTSFGQDEKW